MLYNGLDGMYRTPMCYNWDNLQCETAAQDSSGGSMVGYLPGSTGGLGPN